MDISDPNPAEQAKTTLHARSLLAHLSLDAETMVSASGCFVDFLVEPSKREAAIDLIAAEGLQAWGKRSRPNEIGIHRHELRAWVADRPDPG